MSSRQSPKHTPLLSKKTPLCPPTHLSSVSTSLSMVHLRALRRTRLFLLKSIDPCEVLDAMTPLHEDASFRTDIRDVMLALRSRDERAAILLDRLETSDDQTFTAFSEVLRERYRQVYSVLQDSIRSMDDSDEDCTKERVTIEADTIRRILKERDERTSRPGYVSNARTESPRFKRGEMCGKEEDGGDGGQYLNCYVVTSRGRLQPETWMKHSGVIVTTTRSSENISPSLTSGGHLESRNEDDSTSYMAVVTKDVMFRLVARAAMTSQVSVVVPSNCKEVYIPDEESQYSPVRPCLAELMPNLSVESRVDNGAEALPLPRLSPMYRKPNDFLKGQNAGSRPCSASVPPPLPPKPVNLPVVRAHPVFPIANRQSKISQHNGLDNNSRPEGKVVGRRVSRSNAVSSSPSIQSPPPPLLPSRLPRLLSTDRPRLVPPGCAPALTGDESSPTSTIIVDDCAVTSSSNVNGRHSETDEDEVESEEDDLSLNYAVNLDDPDDEYEPIGEARSGAAWTESQKLTDTTTTATAVANENNSEADTGTTCSSTVVLVNNAMSHDVTMTSLDNTTLDNMTSLDNMASQDVTRITTPDNNVTPHERTITLDSIKLPRKNLPLVAKNTRDEDSRSSPEEGLPNLSARDSGVGSVISQVLVDSPCDGENPAVADKEMFGSTASLGELEIHASPDGDDKSSTDYSYYEDIERVDGFMTSSVYLDPQAASTTSECAQSRTSTLASTGRGRMTVRPPIPAFNFDTLSSDRKVLAKGTFMFVGLHKTVSLAAVGTVNSSSGGEASASSEEDSILGYDKDGLAYYIPTNCLKRYDDPTDEPWFYPVEMTAREASFFLSNENQRGCFLVYRPTSKRRPDVCYVLSVCLGDGGLVLHYDIVKNTCGDLSVEGHDHSFMTLRELVGYFRKNRSRLATRLRRCLKEARLPISPGSQYPRHYEIPRSCVQLNGKILGQGNSCVICQGVYKNTTVTVKILQKDLTSIEEDDFLEEALVLIALKSHENIVQFIGVSCAQRPFYIVTEYLEKGTLKRCLEVDDIPADDVDVHFDVCIQMVSALTYLEGLRYVLHRDLCARNFFLTHDRLVKLSNFERARCVVDDDYHASASETVSVRWCAPEVLKSSCYSTKSDVWALGVVFWEVFSHGADPYARLNDEQIIDQVLDGGRLEKPPGCAHDLYAMMTSCWRQAPNERPSFASLSDKIKGKSSIYYSSSPSLVQSPGISLQSPRLIQSPSVICTSPAVEPKSLTLPSKPKTPTTPRHGNLSCNSSVFNAAASQVSTPRISRADNSLRVIENEREHKRTSSTSTYGAGSERPPTSSSDSLTSAMTSASALNGGGEKEDLTRGDKIRKSLRKFIKKKTPSSASSSHSSREPVMLIKVSSKEH